MEVKDPSVPGPQQNGLTAPLFKGVGKPLVLTPGRAPLPAGWFPEASSSTAPGGETDIESVDTS